MNKSTLHVLLHISRIFRLRWHKVDAVDNVTHYNDSTLIPLPQVGVAVHHYLLIGGGARQGSVSWDGGCVHIGHHVTNTPGDYNSCVILSSDGGVASFTHIAGIHGLV